MPCAHGGSGAGSSPACVCGGEGGESLERTPSQPHTWQQGDAASGVSGVWVQSKYCPALDLRRKAVHLCAARVFVCLCVFFGRRHVDCGWRPAPTEGREVAGGLSDPHTCTSHLARVFVRRGPSLVHSPRGLEPDQEPWNPAGRGGVLSPRWPQPGHWSTTGPQSVAWGPPRPWPVHRTATCPCSPRQGSGKGGRGGAEGARPSRQASQVPLTGPHQSPATNSRPGSRAARGQGCGGRLRGPRRGQHEAHPTGTLVTPQGTGRPSTPVSTGLSYSWNLGQGWCPRKM